MIKEWLSNLLYCFQYKKEGHLVTSTDTDLPRKISRYGQTIDRLRDNPKILFSLLQIRDQVEAAKQASNSLSTDQALDLIALDEKLRKYSMNLPLSELSRWRLTMRPSKSDWWWFLDEKTEEFDRERNLPLVLFSGLLILSTTTLSVEIIRRLLSNAPDTISIFGTLITLTLTASPFIRRRLELARWAQDHIPWIKPWTHTEVMTIVAVLAFLFALLGWLLLPQLAVFYNNWGFSFLQQGDLTIAKRKFQRAVALRPDLVVPYHNVADIYRQIHQPEKAEIWYQNAIEKDLHFVPSYHRLGQLMNEQQEYPRAEGILLAGLQQINENLDEEVRLVSRYRLLSDLGWAYYAQNQYALALDALEECVALEDELEALENDSGEYRLALPHYYLALIYERQGQTTLAYKQWETALRWLKPGWANAEKRGVILEHLKQLEKTPQ